VVLAHHKENFLYTHWDDICISWGNMTWRTASATAAPAPIADANDEPQSANSGQGTLTSARGNAACSDDEGPGHVPMHMIEGTGEACNGATRRRSTRSGRYDGHCARLRPLTSGMRGR